MSTIAERFAAIQEVKPDEWDKKMIADIEAAKDTSEGITLEEMDRIRAMHEYSGKISLRVPKSLHRDLAESAKIEGISLNQFILYKLAQ